LLNSDKVVEGFVRFAFNSRLPRPNAAGVWRRSCSLKAALRGSLAVLAALLLFVLAGCAGNSGTSHAPEPAAMKAAAASASADTTANLNVRAEEIRTDCINGRRLVCGRVLKVCPDGLVVDSGYTDLLRPPLTSSWLVPGSAVASRDPNVLELKEPGTPCIGLVFLTDIPRKPSVKNYDYVILMGYPAGSYAYTPAPGIEKVIRKFAAGLETAVKLQLEPQ
jgi:hypothetical protein